MKKIFLVALMLMVSTQCHAFFVEEKNGDTVTCSYNVDSLSDVEYTAGRDIYVDGVLQARYTAQALIGWAMENYPALIGTPHEAALVAFANDPAGFKDLLVARGAIIDSSVGGTQFSDLAQAIIVEARTLGAKGLD